MGSLHEALTPCTCFFYNFPCVSMQQLRQNMIFKAMKEEDKSCHNLNLYSVSVCVCVPKFTTKLSVQMLKTLFVFEGMSITSWNKDEQFHDSIFKPSLDSSSQEVCKIKCGCMLPGQHESRFCDFNCLGPLWRGLMCMQPCPRPYSDM